MTAYNFKPQFAAPILAKTKTGTVRMVGKGRHARPGGPVSLYVGLRTKHSRRLGMATAVTVRPITINPEAGRIDFPALVMAPSIIDTAALHAFARADGFTGWSDFIGWFRATYPDMPIINGVHIHWANTFVPDE